MSKEMSRAEHRAWLIASAHEGAHAAACAEFGIPMERGEIKVRRTLFGSPQWDGGIFITEDHRISLDSYVLTYLAGPEAEARVTQQIDGGSLDRIRRRIQRGYTGEGDDLDLAAAEIEASSFRSLRHAQGRAQDLVDDLMPSIRRVAAALREGRSLSGRDLAGAA